MRVYAQQGGTKRRGLILAVYMEYDDGTEGEDTYGAKPAGRRAWMAGRWDGRGCSRKGVVLTKACRRDGRREKRPRRGRKRRRGTAGATGREEGGCMRPGRALNRALALRVIAVQTESKSPLARTLSSHPSKQSHTQVTFTSLGARAGACRWLAHAARCAGRPGRCGRRLGGSGCGGGKMEGEGELEEGTPPDCASFRHSSVSPDLDRRSSLSPHSLVPPAPSSSFPTAISSRPLLVVGHVLACNVGHSRRSQSGARPVTPQQARRDSRCTSLTMHICVHFHFRNTPRVGPETTVRHLALPLTITLHHVFPQRELALRALHEAAHARRSTQQSSRAGLIPFEPCSPTRFGFAASVRSSRRSPLESSTLLQGCMRVLVFLCLDFTTSHGHPTSPVVLDLHNIDNAFFLQYASPYGHLNKP
ncbi:hypothetical protein C8Q70DRAFT_221169 [Cubamyces menziesii]|nr:hypothetical protein C8Q70DRAFT_221169 [Cubamyces menziesii]